MMHLDNDAGLGQALRKFKPLRGKRVALLEAEGFDPHRLETLREAYELAGAEVVLIAPTDELEDMQGKRVSADISVSNTAAEVYHALCVPGSARAIATLRDSTEACEFVRSFVQNGKWVALLDHGPLLLESIGVSAGRTLTSDPDLKDELVHTGAHWASEPVICDQQLITAQGDAQLATFLRVSSLSFQEKPSEPPPGYH